MIPLFFEQDINVDFAANCCKTPSLRPLACGGHAPHLVCEPDHLTPGVIHPLPGAIRRALDKSVAMHHLHRHGHKSIRKTGNSWGGGGHIQSRSWRQTWGRQETAGSSHGRNVLASARGGITVCMQHFYHKSLSNSQGNTQQRYRFPRGITSDNLSIAVVAPPAIATAPATATAAWGFY